MLLKKEQDWVAMQPLMFTEQKWKEAEKEAEKITSLLELPAGAAILDLPCGVGRHTVELAKRGYTVTGVDLVQKFLDDGNELATKSGVTVEWLAGDMRAFRHDKRFDAVINMYTSFGYFRDEQENRQVAETFFACLKPGGKLLLDLMSYDIFTHKFQNRRTETQEGTSTLVYEFELEPDNWLCSHWTVTQGTHTQKFHRSMKLYSRDALVQLLTEVGFGNFKIFGDLDRSPYSGAAEHLIVVCERPR